MVRDASINELNAIYELEKQFGVEAFNLRSLRHFINKRALKVYVINNNIVGSAIVLERKNSTKVRLYSFIIDYKYRGQYFGEAFLSALNTLNGKWTEIRLEVSHTNTTAINLYSKQDFQPYKVIKNYYKDGSDAIKMKKLLT